MNIKKNRIITVFTVFLFAFISGLNMYAEPPAWAPAHGWRDKDGDKGPPEWARAWGKRQVKHMKVYNESGARLIINVPGRSNPYYVNPTMKSASADLPEGLKFGKNDGSDASEFSIKIDSRGKLLFEKTYKMVKRQEEITLKQEMFGISNKQNLDVSYQPEQKTIVIAISPSPEGKYASNDESSE